MVEPLSTHWLWLLAVNLTIISGAVIVAVTTSNPGIDYSDMKHEVLWTMRVVFLLEFVLKVSGRSQRVSIHIYPLDL